MGRRDKRRKKKRKQDKKMKFIKMLEEQQKLAGVETHKKKVFD